MKRRNTFFLSLLAIGLLVQCDDEVPWLEFPADVVSRHYKIGNVVSGEDPTSPQSILDAFAMIEGLSRGGSEDIAVVTVPDWINWEGYVIQEVADFVTTLKTYDVEVHFVVDPLPHRVYLGGQDPPPPGSSFSNPDVRQAYKDFCLDAVTRLSPEYMTLGVEINMYYHGFGISDFVYLNSLINETADLVRAVSPETKTLISVQWEHLLLFKDTNGWEPIENFEWNIDVLGISSFPMAYMMVLDPSRLPQNYYSQVFDHYPPNHTPDTLPMAFTEIGFPSRVEVGYDGSEKHQSNGVITLIERATQFEHLEFINFWYLHDNDGYHRQISLGLIESTTTPEGTPGRKKPSYFIWRNLGILPYIPN